MLITFPRMAEGLRVGACRQVDTSSSPPRGRLLHFRPWRIVVSWRMATRA